MTAVVPDPATPDHDAVVLVVDADDYASGALTTEARGPRLPHFPAIEGLRGVAVMAVLFFHAGFTWMKGGYLGVSTFFTLSGFLITALLLAERGATAQIDLRRFWARRFRRLMPASLAALALALVFGWFAADAVQQRNLAGDVIACLAYVANWRFLFSNQSYADLFGAPSPVLQFWSLAIEEQFYLLYPLFAWFALHKLHKSRAWFGGVLAAMIMVSLGITLFGGLSNDAIYYGTETRAAEILVGALLAVIIYQRRVTHTIANDEGVRTAVAGVGVVALLVCVGAWITVAQTRSEIYDGGLFVYALFSAAVILAAITPAGPVRWLLAVGPLRYLGRISYGLYLFHWPVFLWISADRTGLSTTAVFVPRIIVTFALAILSYRFLETPVRRGDRLFRVPPVRLAPVAIGAVALAAILVTLAAPKPVIDFDTAAAQLQNLATTPPAKPIDPTAADAPFPRMAIFGDSTALMTGIGVSDWATAGHNADFVDGAAWLGCGIGRGGERRSGKDIGPIPDQCNHWERTWGQKIRDNQPNIAIVQIGPWEVADRKLENDDTWRAPGDPVYDAYLTQEMTLAVDTLSAGGADVIWLTSPPVGAGKGEDAIQIRGQAADPARMVRLNQLIEALPAARPGKVHVVDLAGWLASTGDDQRLRPDGVHFGPDESKEVAKRWLGPTIVTAYKDDWAKRNAIGAKPAPGSTVPAPGSTVPTTAPASTADPSTSAAPGTTAAVPPATVPGSTTYTGPKRKVLVLGDASSAALADAVKAWGDSSGSLEVVSLQEPDCGIVKTTARNNKGTTEPTPAECDNMVFAWLQAVVTVKPDIVLIIPSAWDLVDGQLVGDTQLRGLGDPAYDDAILKQYTALADSLHKGGPAVAWMNMAPNGAVAPDRIGPYSDVLAQVALAGGPTRPVGRIDFAKFATTRSPSDPALFGDGASVSAAAAPAAGEWTGNEVLVYFDEFQASGK